MYRITRAVKIKLRKFSQVRISALMVIANLMLVVGSSGCIPLLVGGTVTGGLAAQDERTIGSFLDDQGIENKLLIDFGEFPDDKVNVSATSYNQRVLLVGQVVSEEYKQQITDIAQNVSGVLKIFNQVQITETIDSSYFSDAGLTSQVKFALCGVQDPDTFNCNRIKVVSEASVVYLMGIVSEQNAKVAVDVSRRVEGVKQVVGVMEIVEETSSEKFKREEREAREKHISEQEAGQ